MIDKIEIAFKYHIKRLQIGIAQRKREQQYIPDALHIMLDRDDKQKIALLREGVIPKYSDLPATDGYENNLPAIKMHEFENLNALQT